MLTKIFFYYNALLVFKSETSEYYHNELNIVFRDRQFKNNPSVNIYYVLSKRWYYQSTHHTIPGVMVDQEHRFENVKSRITKFILISMKVAAQDELILYFPPNSVLAVDDAAYQGCTRYISNKCCDTLTFRSWHSFQWPNV